MSQEIIQSILSIEINHRYAFASEAKKLLKPHLGYTFDAICTGPYRNGYEMPYGEEGLPDTTKELLGMGLLCIKNGLIFLHKDIHSKLDQIEKEERELLAKVKLLAKKHGANNAPGNNKAGG